MKQPYKKAFKTYVEQLEKLKQRGMSIEDDAKALFYLTHLNYYRLQAYWIPFEQNHDTHQFKAGTTFEQVLELYHFDRELRLLVLDAIERIEVSLRAVWAYEMAKIHGSHAHLEPLIWTNKNHHQNNEQKLTEEVERSKEVFIQHFKNTYSEASPPIWAVCEVMSLGLLSRYYKNLNVLSNVSSVKKSIAQQYHVPHPFLESVLHQLSVIRNMCAHHSRLWNRNLLHKPCKPNHIPTILKQAYQPNDDRLYNSLLILLHFMDVVAPQHSWRLRLKTLLEEHPENLPHMGFPVDWQNQPIWK
jgi:abortive infection bacteriophage resistance protein